ncbi:uncharacterized protein LOC130511208 [Raphanus sativus]|uniref:Uncharacterized protein LOC130511208 n=1 Tax=Raphanus sativus TaxID=3726 RepID=A0A9W3DJZ2_RAPSA|nr:uncharacterized protein LOC130511208 [Raphanus sativus]
MLTQEILPLAKIEEKLWNDYADPSRLLPADSSGLLPAVPTSDFLESTRVFYVYGAWKEHDVFTGQGWYCRRTDSKGIMMGAMNLRRSLSPLHAECEALIWAMECMKTLQFSDVVFATDCSQLVKMVSSPEE